MKDYLIFAIFLYLVKHQQATAKNIAKHFEISERSVYRYIDALSLLGVPVITKLGRNGGIELIHEYYINGIMLNMQEKQIIKEFIVKSTKIGEVKKILQKLI